MVQGELQGSAPVHPSGHSLGLDTTQVLAQSSAVRSGSTTAVPLKDCRVLSERSAVLMPLPRRDRLMGATTGATRSFNPPSQSAAPTTGVGPSAGAGSGIPWTPAGSPEHPRTEARGWVIRASLVMASLAATMAGLAG